MTLAPPPPLQFAPLPTPLVARPGILPLSAASEAALRAALIAEAMTWVGTPYRQLGDTKGVAVDCSMLLVRVMVDSGIVEAFDPRPYPPNWFMHREDERYIDWLATIAVEVTTPQPGDFDVMKMGRAFAHSGIIVSDTHIVHAFADLGQCRCSERATPVLHYANRRGDLRLHRYFDIFGGLRRSGQFSAVSGQTAVFPSFLKTDA